jgi:hypothetical protein
VRHVAVDLFGTADTGGPEVRVGLDAHWQLSFADDVTEGQPSARLEYPLGLLEDLPLLGGEVDYAVRDDRIEGGVTEREILDMAFAEREVVEALVRCEVVGLLDLL